MGLKSVPGMIGVNCPENWTDEQIYWLKRAHEAGVREGRREVRDPIIQALGINTMLSDLEMRLDNS